MKYLKFSFFIVCFCNQFCFSQNTYFEGIVEYKFLSYNTDFKSKDVFKLDKKQMIQEEILYFQGGNFMFQITKGYLLTMFGNKTADIIVRGKEGKHFRLEHQDSTAYLLIHKNELDSNIIPKSRPTGREKSIIGYVCLEYEVESISLPSHKKVINYIWVTRDIEIESIEDISRILGYRSDITTGYNNIKGLVLEAHLQVDNGKLIIKASNIDEKKLDENIFKIPNGYKQKEEMQN